MGNASVLLKLFLLFSLPFILSPLLNEADSLA